MPAIPDEARRILEDKLDKLLQTPLKSPTYTATMVFQRAFPEGKLVSVERARLH